MAAYNLTRADILAAQAYAAREKDFSIIAELRAGTKGKSAAEVERDVAEAIKQTRTRRKRQSGSCVSH